MKKNFSVTKEDESFWIVKNKVKMVRYWNEKKAIDTCKKLNIMSEPQAQAWLDMITERAEYIET